MVFACGSTTSQAPTGPPLGNASIPGSVRDDAVDPTEFRKVLDGWWDTGGEAESRQFCTPGRTLHRHVFSEDGRALTWAFERPEKIYDGTEVSSVTYRIIGATSVTLTLALEGETRLNPKGAPIVWELVVIADGVFRWRATHFPFGTYNRVWGKRCPPDSHRGAPTHSDDATPSGTNGQKAVPSSPG